MSGSGKLEKEFADKLQKENGIYIYGAGKIAKRLLSIIDYMEFKDKVKGIVVTKKTSIDEFDPIWGGNIIEIDKFNDIKSLIIIGVSQKYKKEIVDILNSRGISNYIYGFRYIHIFDEIHESPLTKIEKPHTDKELKTIIHEVFGGNQLFGDEGKLYQSFPELNIEGLRPTDKRLVAYGLPEIVRGKKVLDIGCNCGFLDISISKYVEEVLGIEYNASLVDIANLTAEYLNVENVYFRQGDFNFFCSEEVYDVVLLFAVHGWINTEPREFVNKIERLLDKNGIVVFESQDLSAGDPMYERITEKFQGIGYKIIKESEICDDEKTRRLWRILVR